MLGLAVVWLHVVAAAAWFGGLLYTSHLVLPAISRGSRDGVALLVRGRIVAWTALALLLVTGLDNLRRVPMATPWLAAKLLIVLGLLAPAAALRGVRALDRVLLLLALGTLFLAVGVARGR
jgi:putative copper export protein